MACSRFHAAVGVAVVFLVCLGVAAQERETPTAIPVREAPPWVQDEAGPPKLPVQELAGPRQLLELFNVDASLLDRFSDRRPLHPDEYETLYRVLYRIPRFHRHDLLRWRSADWDWETVVEHPADYRADSVRLTGRVKRIEKEAVLPEAAKVLEYDHFFRVEFAPDNAPHPALVFAREMPAAWKTDQSVDYRASVEGLFLKIAETEDGGPQVVAACNRVAWHPEKPDPVLGVSQDHVLLATLGMDVGQLDLASDRKSLSGDERECFYQLLDAARRSDPALLKQRAEGRADLAPLLQSPDQVRGEVFGFSGEVRRVQQIQVDEKDVQLRFGIDHYYEIDIFLPLENQTIRMGEGEDAPIFESYYPMIFCVARLPKGIKPEDLVHREVRIPAYFFKLWAYETEFMKRYNERGAQISPMLIGHSPELLPAPALPTGTFGTVAAFVFVATLAMTWVWLWRAGQRDTDIDRELRRRRLRPDETKSLNDIPAQGAPDFRHLNEAEKPSE